MISFDYQAFDDYAQWANDDKKIFAKIKALATAIARDPFRGIGKPEPLKGNMSGYWSRRITDEHRLVYKVEAGRIIVVSCKGHYE